MQAVDLFFMATKAPNINLIHGHKSLLDGFIDWALTIGRVVIILTEGIALSAFLYRFTLDRQIIDLHQQINQKQKILSFQKAEEDKYRNLQDRLALIGKLSAKVPISVLAFNDIAQIIPNSINVTSFSISNESVEINAETSSITALSSLIKSLKSYNRIQSVSLDKIENRTSTSTIVFGISMQLKKQ